MTVFQYLVIALLFGLSFATVRAAFRGGVRKRIAFFWQSIWAVAAAVVIWPDSTVLVARALGIGRGADLVMYCSVFAMLIGFFYIYVRFRRMDRALTTLVRRLAVENPLLPEEKPLHPKSAERALSSENS